LAQDWLRVSWCRATPNGTDALTARVAVVACDAGTTTRLAWDAYDACTTENTFVPAASGVLTEPLPSTPIADGLGGYHDGSFGGSPVPRDD
jgi:hypothetical protein